MPTTTDATTCQTERARARRRGRFVPEGIVVGLIGAAIVMLWFLTVDLAAGIPLRTPARLGAALFHGARGAGPVPVTASLVLGYTAVHLAGFVALGLGVAGLFALAEREKRVLWLIFMLGCCLTVVFMVMVYVLAQWLQQAMTPTVVLAGHVLGGLGALAALLYRHRRLVREFPTAGE